VAALGTGLIFHHYDIMAGGGVDRLTAAVFVPFGFVTAGTNLLTGVLMDRVPPRFLLSAMLLLGASLAFAPTSPPRASSSLTASFWVFRKA
jgi:MFS transporter, OFA family, oxalate/formate antiporter